MEKQNQLRGRHVDINLIRTVAIIGVILLHAAGRYAVTSQDLSQMNPLQFAGWGAVDFYQSIAVIVGVPLFLMTTGALLLEPSKNESLKVFFKKRWARIGLPLVFWGAIYFVWDFLVMKVPFTAEAIVQGILNGPYTQFWYMYVLIGLYLLTPILRVFIAHADEALVKYFLLVWIVGVSVLPFIGLFTTFTLSNNVFTLTGYLGYFVLGTYLLTVNIKRSTLVAFAAGGIALTALGTYALAVTGAAADMYFFQEYFSPTILVASIMLFMLLLTVKPQATQNPTARSPGSKLVNVIGESTLAIFFVHVIILESLENGYLGLALNRLTLNPIVEVPLITVIVLFASLGVVLLLKKVPFLKRIVG